MNAKELKLDYFQIYRIADQDEQGRVYLQGQFDKIPEPFALNTLNWFCAPVSKRGEPIYDKYAHLVRHRPKQPIPQPARVVEIENQFGKQKLLIGDVIGLLAPARKIERGSVFPAKLDHYKIYKVHEGKPVNREVKLQDQFAGIGATVGYPYAFAVPVKKQHGDKTFPIQNKRAHLVLYYLHPVPEIAKAIRFNDQFGTRYAQALWACMLAAPSLKRKWSEA